MNPSQTGLGDSDFRVLEVLLHKGSLPVNTIGPNTDDRRVRLVELTLTFIGAGGGGTAEIFQYLQKRDGIEARLLDLTLIEPGVS